MDNVALARRLINPPDGNWQPLLDHLADDVVFRVTIPEGTPISGEFRGKSAVIQHFRQLPELLEFRQEQPMEFFADGDRVVVIGREAMQVRRNGETVSGSDYTDVIDFRDGLITHFLVIQDLTAVVDAYRDGWRTETDERVPAGSVERVHRFFELLARKDLGAWGELWHEQARIIVEYPPDGFSSSIDGRSAILAAFHELFAGFDSWTAEITAVYPAADTDAVAVEYIPRATLTNGSEYTNRNIVVFRFRDGRIMEYHDYFDPRRFQTVVDATR